MGRYAGLTALGTLIILSPKKAQGEASAPLGNNSCANKPILVPRSNTVCSDEGVGSFNL